MGNKLQINAILGEWVRANDALDDLIGSGLTGELKRLRLPREWRLKSVLSLRSVPPVENVGCLNELGSAIEVAIQLHFLISHVANPENLTPHSLETLSSATKSLAALAAHLRVVFDGTLPNLRVGYLPVPR